jgi:hypothetical protein
MQLKMQKKSSRNLKRNLRKELLSDGMSSIRYGRNLLQKRWNSSGELFFVFI